MTRFVAVCPDSFAPRWTILRWGSKMSPGKIVVVIYLDLKTISGFVYLVMRHQFYCGQVREFWGKWHRVFCVLQGLQAHNFFDFAS